MFDFPSVYRFSKKGSEYHLYLGEYSTVDALSKFDLKTAIQITEFGAAHFDNSDYTSLKKLPVLDSVESVIAYLNNLDATITLINFTAMIEGFGSLSTHDDGECHIITDSEKGCFDFVRKVTPIGHACILIDALKQNPEVYLRSDRAEAIQLFDSFEDYSEWSTNQPQSTTSAARHQAE